MAAGEIDWYVITTDEARFRLSVTPPGSPAWQAELAWSSVVRVCFEAGDLHDSDTLYVYCRERAESWVVPTLGTGGTEFLTELIRRGLFDAGLAVEASTALSGLYCWPPLETPPAQN